jgi:hypothetical protein
MLRYSINIIAYYLKRVNSHAKRRELSTSVLGNFRLIPQLSENKNQKWTSYCFYLSIGIQI